MIWLRKSNKLWCVRRKDKNLGKLDRLETEFHKSNISNNFLNYSLQKDILCGYNTLRILKKDKYLILVKHKSNNLFITMKSNFK